MNEIELKKLYDRIKELGYELSLSDKAKAFIAEKGFDRQFGARPLKRIITKEVENLIAEKLLKSELNPGQVVVLDEFDGGLGVV